MKDERPLPTLTFSEVESSRFGLDVFRCTLGESMRMKDLVRQVLEERPDLVVLRVPCAQQNHLRELGKTGLPHLLCDTLLYYYVDLTRYEVKERRNADIEFVKATVEHEPLLDDMVADIFADYHNHYSANPLIRTNLLPGYQEWVRGFVEGESDHKAAWIAYRGDTPVAFATCLTAEGTPEGVLYGVRPGAAGAGVYGDLIRYTQRWYQQKGFKEMKVSTQVWNYAVQKVWVREGFVLTESLNTIHLMPMMGRGLEERHEQEISFTKEQIAAFGEISGDLNPLHFDGDYARSKGFEDRLSHGVLVTGAPSKYFGVENPGPGTLFLGFEYRFSKPVYPGRKYHLETGFFPFQEGSKFRKALAIVHDETGDICLFGYNDLYIS